MERLNAALRYKNMGLSVIPLIPRDKKPLIDWAGYQKKRAEPDTISDWFSKNPDANVGIVTGAVSGVIVLDVDGPEGQETLRKKGLSLPPTVTAKTGGGGFHYFYKYPGFECRNFAGGKGETILPGVDFRGDGGYVVAPGSIHPNGSKYEWSLGPGEEKIAAAPEWLVELIWNQQGLGGSNGVLPQEWAEAVPAGRRNTTLARLAGSLLTRMQAEDALPMLLAWNRERCSPPLPEGEVRKTVHSIAGREAEKTSGEDWPQPDKLEVELLPVEPLPPALIPEPFRPWLEDVAERMQCPIDFLAAAAMIVAGSVIGSGCGMCPKQRDSWEVIPNLWGGVIARPGMLKTPALTEVMGPLRRLEVDAKTEFEEVSGLAEAELAAHRAAVEAIKAEMSRMAKGRGQPGTSMEALKNELAALEEPVFPVRRRYLTNDPTVEKMAELLNENSRGILYFRDELTGLLLNLDREDRQADRAFYLESWNGFGSYTTDRIGRGTIDTNNLCVSILGGIQPSRLLGYLHEAKSDLGNDGLIQRFQLLVYPDEPTEWKLVDEWPDTGAKNRAFAIFEALSKADFLALGAEDGDDRPYFRFSLEAQEIFNDWLTNLQFRLQKNEEPIITEHLAKYRSLMPSLALIIHLVDAADGKAEGPVSLLAAQKAAAWCEYLESHARRIYSMGAQAALSAAQALAQKILDGDVGDVFTGRDVYINNWSKLTNSKAVEKATDELIAAGWLRKEIKQTGGRPSTIFKVNPVVYTRG